MRQSELVHSGNGLLAFTWTEKPSTVQVAVKALIGAIYRIDHQQVTAFGLELLTTAPEQRFIVSRQGSETKQMLLGRTSRPQRLQQIRHLLPALGHRLHEFALGKLGGVV